MYMGACQFEVWMQVLGIFMCEDSVHLKMGMNEAFYKKRNNQKSVRLLVLNWNKEL